MRILLSLSLLSLTACGFTGKDLGSIEKRADIEWMFGVFERNYAPADWKHQLHGVSLESAKSDCLTGSESITKGDAFLSHLSRCVNRFRDAHTKLVAGGQILPEFARVAYLGIQTELARFDINSLKEGEDARYVTALRVKDILPTTEAEAFPLAKNDIVLEINGRPVDQILLSELVPFNDLGQDASSLALAAMAFPLRTSFEREVPAQGDVYFKVVRSTRIFDVKLPWTVKDLLEFQHEQADALARRKEKESKPAPSAQSTPWVGAGFADYFLRLFSEYRLSLGERIPLLLTSTFRVFFYDPAISVVMGETEEEKLPFEAALPEEILVDVSTKTFPARMVLLKDGKRIGYVRIASFGLGDPEVKEFLDLIALFGKSRVDGLVLDLLDNGGGSLTHGLRMANALTSKEIQYPSMQLMLNDNWLNGFRADSLYAKSDARRTLAGRIYKQLRSDVGAGRRLSRPISSAELDPLVLGASKAGCVEEGTCLPENTKLVLLANEMCASMCDIFASTFRDNGLGLVIGSRTMGAGGNVVLHGVAPVSKAALMQTESLIVDLKGEYLENQGVEPDVAIDTVLDRAAKFSATYLKALEILKQ